LQGTRLYVLTRFNNSISVVDTTTKNEVQTLALHNPEPASVVTGRPFLYDANLTSSNGEASCSSCHIGGDMDDLGWDLGNPDDLRKPNLNPMNDEPFVDIGFDSCVIQQFAFGNGCTFHPMKGPMTTQSLRGLDLQGPQHWRGDREGNATSSFLAFNGAFPGLVGRATTLDPGDMIAFKDFALQLRYPPNPTRDLVNVLTPIQASGQTVFDAANTDQVASCNDCHTLDPANGFFGGDGRSTFDAGTEIFKVPHLRNLYQKVGMFGAARPQPTVFPQIGTVTAFDGPYTHQGDQIRGFGYAHDGSVDTLFRFVSSSLFDINNTEQNQVEAFMIAFDSDLAPVVGQQITLTATNAGVAELRIDLMLSRCGTGFASKVLVDLNGGPVNECDLIAKLSQGGNPRGYVYDTATDLFEPDDGGAAISDAALRALAGAPNQEVTYTAVPPGSGYRMGINRDLDNLLDAPDNCPGVPNDDQGDTDDDGLGDACDSTPLPEPAQIPMLAVGVIGLNQLHRRRRAKRGRSARR
jgi:YVTN family beta-propeller protein